MKFVVEAVAVYYKQVQVLVLEHVYVVCGSRLYGPQGHKRFMSLWRNILDTQRSTATSESAA